MRFLMINCLKYAQQCQIGIFKKILRIFGIFRATTVHHSVMCISPRYYVNIVSIGNPLIPDAEKHFVVLLLSEFKNRYVMANINL